jgi:hypothetical protein
VEWILALAEHYAKYLKVEYLGQIENNFQKSGVTASCEHKVLVSAKKSKKFNACVPLTTKV